MSGWNGSDRRGASTPVQLGAKHPPSGASFAKQSGTRGVPSMWKGIAAGIFVVAALSVALYFVYGGKESGAGTVKAKEPKKFEKPNTGVSKAAKSVRKEKDSTETPSGGAITNEAQGSQFDKVSQAETSKPFYSSNCVTRPLDPNDPNAHLAQGVNQEIGALLSNQLGEEPAPFPYSFMAEGDDKEQDDDFLKNFKKKIVFDKNDSDAEREHKAAMLQSRLDLLDALNEGKSVNQTIKEAYQYRMHCFECRNALCSDLTSWVKEYNPTEKEFETMFKKYNDKLGESGIKPLEREEVLVEDNEEVKE